MIPLTTKLPAICSLLRRVLEMDEKATKDWIQDQRFANVLYGLNDDETGIAFDNENDAVLISFSRNLTKPQATALLISIQTIQHEASFKLDPCTKENCDTALQSIADAFPDALFQDSSRCA